MSARLAALLLLATSPLAFAQPLGPRPENLRVDIRCADQSVTPESGLSVSVDGLPVQPVGANAVPTYTDGGVEEDWIFTDVAYSVTPGVHFVRFAAPGCAPLQQDLVFAPVRPIYVTGRLPVASGSLRGPTGAPDGGGTVLGAYENLRGAHTSQDPVFSSRYTYEPTSTEGLWLSIPYEHRSLVLAFDLQIGGGAVAGTARDPAQGAGSGPYPLDGTAFEVGSVLRLGARSSIDHVAIAAGSGIGGDVWLGPGHVHAPAGDAIEDPSIDATWYIPVWAAIDYKTSCTWGVQLLASYDIHPGDRSNDAPAFGAGLLWQPSSACSEPARLSVHR